MTKYECVRCTNRYEGEVDCPKCGCGVATSVHPDDATAKPQKLQYLDKLLPQVTAITDYLSEHGLGTWGADCLPEALELIKKHVPLPGASIELPCQPVRKLADRVATAVCGDRQIAGYDVEMLSQSVFGPRLKALIVEMAGYEAEAYALQDQVDEANSSVTALEQRIAELTAQNEKLSQDFAATVDYMNEGCICGRAPAPKHPVDPRLLRK